MTAAAATIQAFFTERLAAQRRASPHTVTAYRGDALRMLLGFAAARTGTLPCRLDIADLDAPMIAAFLDHLEHERGNTIRTRNARLAAIHSLFAYAALRHPEHAADIERVLAIPPKKVPGGWRRGVPAKLGRRGGCGWSRAGVAGDRCAARAPGPAP